MPIYYRGENNERIEVNHMAKYRPSGFIVVLPQTIMEIPCYHIDDFEEVVEQNDISIVIISLPSSLAAQYAVPIINAGIKGVLNFTSVPMNFPQGIVVENYDITTILEKVAYFVKAAEENNNQ